MDKEKLIELLQKGTEVKELTKDKAYILQVEVGDMPKETQGSFFKFLSEKLREFGLEKFLLIPASNGQPSIKFFEIKEENN